MSLALAELRSKMTKKNPTRAEILALQPDLVYDDGRTKQSFKDETDINKIMARFDVTGTISHVSKYVGQYADYSDYDFHEQTERLTKGREIFDALPAELRREFGQSPQAFFNHVNDPENATATNFNLPALAEPGQQLPRTATSDADNEAALAAASEPASEKPIPTPPDTGGTS